MYSSVSNETATRILCQWIVSFPSVPTAVHPRRSRITKSVFKGVFIPKSQLQNLLIFTAFYPSNNFPSIISARPSPKWHWVALGVAGHGWVWLTACWRSRPRPTRSVLGLKGKTNWLQQRALWKAGWNWVELPTVNQSDISVRVSCNATSGSWKSTGSTVKILGLLKTMKKRYQGACVGNWRLDTSLQARPMIIRGVVLMAQSCE